MKDTSFKHCLEVKNKFDLELKHLSKLSIVRPIDIKYFTLYCKLCDDLNNFTQEAVDNTLLLKFAANYEVYDGYNVFIYEQDDLNLDNGYLAGMTIENFVKLNSLDFIF